MDGLLVINKPLGIPSRKVVDRVNAWFPRANAGHAGTLDPLATGVLVVCLGSATRLIEYVQRMDKTYRTVIQLGATSATDDTEGPIRPMHDARPPTRTAVTDCLRGFLGHTDQVPPAHSAAKVEGRRAYRLARKGVAVELKPRQVRIDRIEVIRFEYPELELQVECGKGTYIRSLARDIGERLCCGGYVATLQRTRIGAFAIESALAFDSGAQQAQSRLLPLEAAVAELSKLVLDAELLARLRLGQRLELTETALQAGELGVFDSTSRFHAIAEWNPELHRLSPRKIFS